MKSRRFIQIGLISVLGILAISVVLIAHNVDQKITLEDKKYIELILEQAEQPLQIDEESPQSQNFDAQIHNILAIQSAAFHTAPDKGVIPIDHPREPKNLYESNSAYCGDRARFIEKALRQNGFETRFVSIYERQPGVSILKTMTTRSKSHALVEVKTAKGWMIVDTRTHFISLDADSNPVSLRRIQDMAEQKNWPAWSPRLDEGIYFLMEEPFWVFYGLYSRHGQFYAPYTPYIPDYDMKQLLINITHGH